MVAAKKPVAKVAPTKAPANQKIKSRNSRGQNQRTIAQKEQDYEAAKMAAQSIPRVQIAKHFKVSPSTVTQMIQRSFKDVPTGWGVEELRRIEMMKLDELEERARKVLTGKHVFVTQLGKVVWEDEDSKVAYQNDALVLEAIRTMITLQGRRAKLLGLDAPSKVAMTDPSGAAIDVGATLEVAWSNLQAILLNAKAS